MAATDRAVKVRRIDRRVRSNISWAFPHLPPGGMLLLIRPLFVCCVVVLSTCGSEAMAQHRSIDTLAELRAPERVGSAAEWSVTHDAPIVLRKVKIDLTGPALSRPAPMVQLVLGGIAGGALGLYAGAYVGYAVEETGVRADLWGRSSEYVPAGALLGAIAGETLLLPLGVHLANGRQGKYWSSALLSAGVTAAGLLLAVPTAGISLLVIPVGQLYTSVRNERATAQAVVP
jgi:hypothetical protein